MPIVYLRMKPYLKEFILGMKTADGVSIYGKEPIHIPQKDRLGFMIERFRRKPHEGKTPARPLTAEDRKRYLMVEIDTNPLVANDDKRLFISDDNMVRIGTYIYNLFCSFAFDYVREHLIWQEKELPNSRPYKTMAYRAFIEEYELFSADEDSIRKAIDRDSRTLPFDLSGKKKDKKKFRFQPKNLPFQT